MIFNRSYEEATGLYELIIADPPYGVTQCDWDLNVHVAETMWTVLQGLLTPNGVVVVHGMQPFSTEVVDCAPMNWFRYELIWEKTKPSGHLNVKKRPLSCHEHLLIFSPAKLGSHTYNAQKVPGEPYKGTTRKKTAKTAYGKAGGHREDNDGFRWPRSVLTFAQPAKGWHPTRKPQALCNWLIKTYSNEGDKVLEPFGGSCPVHLACESLNRHCDSYETNQEYYAKLVDEYFVKRKRDGSVTSENTTTN